MAIHDRAFKRIVSGNKKMLVPWYLMAAYRYEVLDDPILSDGAWDKLCKDLNREWINCRHYHRHLIDRSTLSTGTASYLKFDEWPKRIHCAAIALK